MNHVFGLDCGQRVQGDTWLYSQHVEILLTALARFIWKRSVNFARTRSLFADIPYGNTELVSLKFC